VKRKQLFIWKSLPLILLPCKSR